MKRLVKLEPIEYRTKIQFVRGDGTFGWEWTDDHDLASKTKGKLSSKSPYLVSNMKSKDGYTVLAVAGGVPYFDTKNGELDDDTYFTMSSGAHIAKLQGDERTWFAKAGEIVDDMIDEVEFVKN